MMRSNGRNLGWVAGALIASALWAGCESPPPAAPQGGQVTLRPIDRPAYDRLIQEHSGQVILVDFWATWCPPCRELFPHTLALHRRYASQGLHVVTVSMDDPSSQANALAFLQRHNATTDNFIVRNGGTPQAAVDFEIDGGVIPHLKVYDRQGRPRPPIVGAYEDQIDQTVMQLLNER